MTPQRIQRSRRKGSHLPAGAVCVTRPGRWSNPYRADVFGLTCCLGLFKNSLRGVWDPGATDHLDEARQKAAYMLHRGFVARFKGQHPLEAARVELRGKVLACWCPLPAAGEPDRCHAAILLTAANQPEPR